MSIRDVKNTAECPSCKHPVEFTLGELAAEAAIGCGGCGGSIKLTDKDGGAKKLIGNMDDFTDQFPKNITFKL
jgi:hypothetical protein